MNPVEDHMNLEPVDMDLGKNNMNRLQIHMNGKPVHMNQGINIVTPE